MSQPPPRTIDEAVERLREDLSVEALAAVAAMSEDGLRACHFGLGMYIRNEFGLWQQGSPLLQDCMKDAVYIHPDDASMLIVRALWAKLRH
jgi:hypothetical protein